MKKRKFFIQWMFDDEVVSVPVDDEKRAIPNAISWGGKVTAVYPADSSDRKEVIWWRVQDKFDKQTKTSYVTKESKLPMIQDLADEIWSDDPKLPKTEIGRRLSKKGYGNAKYISENIKKK